MKRIYYVTSIIDSAEKITEDLHKEGISDWNFHVLSKDKEGLYSHHVNSARYWQERDIVHSALRGVIVGGLVGLVAGFLINLASGYPALSLPLMFLIGALFGTWLGGILGQAHESYKIARFHKDIEAGKYLIMVDVHKDEEAKIKTVMKRHHPEAKMSGEGTTLINPFKGHMGAPIDVK